MLTDEHIPGGACYKRIPVFRDVSLRKYHLDDGSNEWRKSGYWQGRRTRFGSCRLCQACHDIIRIKQYYFTLRRRNLNKSK